MKNLQKGFTMFIMITIVSLLIIWGGVYFYIQNNSTAIDTPFSTNVQSTKNENDQSVTITPKSDAPKTDPLANIQVLSNTTLVGGFNPIEGGPSPCQPDFFDPKVTKFQKVPTVGSPAELYKSAGVDEGWEMMINGWKEEGENKILLAEPFNLTIYEFGCASSFSFVADITKSGIRQSLFTNIDNFLTQKSVSEDKTHIFIVNNVKNTNGEWQLKKRIVNIKNNTKIDLPNMSCVSKLGFWNGNKLLTYSDHNLPLNGSSDRTKICVWNTEGKLLSQVSADLYWGSASVDFLRAQIGLLPNDSNIFYIYNQPNTYGNSGCYVNFQDLNNQSRNKKIKIGNYDTSKTICPDIEMNLGNTTFDSNTIPYQIVTR